MTSIRIDENLYNAFKPVAVAKFGSVCRAVEAIMAGVLGALDSLEKLDAYRPTTIEIKSMPIVREMRSRRKHEVGNPMAYSVDELEVVEDVARRAFKRNRVRDPRYILEELKKRGVPPRERPELKTLVWQRLRKIEEADQNDHL